MNTCVGWGKSKDHYLFRAYFESQLTSMVSTFQWQMPPPPGKLHPSLGRVLSLTVLGNYMLMKTHKYIKCGMHLHFSCRHVCTYLVDEILHICTFAYINCTNYDLDISCHLCIFSHSNQNQNQPLK